MRARRDAFRFLIAPPIVIGSDESAIAVMHRALDEEETGSGLRARASVYDWPLASRMGRSFAARSLALLAATSQTIW